MAGKMGQKKRFTDMAKQKFTQKDIAASRQIWWNICRQHDASCRRELRTLLGNGLRSFLNRYYDPRNCSAERARVIEILANVKLQYIWAKLSFDGGGGYRNTEVLITKLEEIQKLANSLAEATSEFEQLHFIGDISLNADRLKEISDSQNVKHTNHETFYGGLMSRLCIDCTVVAEGLTGLRQRVGRKTGRPPIVSRNFILLCAMDLYENLFRLGQIVWTSPIDPKGPQSYTGDFWEFVLSFTDLLTPDDFPQKRGNTGFGSDIGKALTAYRRDPELPKSLNPEADAESLVLYANRLSTLR